MDAKLTASDMSGRESQLAAYVNKVGGTDLVIKVYRVCDPETREVGTVGGMKMNQSIINYFRITEVTGV